MTNFKVHFKVSGIEYIIPISDTKEIKRIATIFELDPLEHQKEYQELFDILKLQVQNNNLLRVKK